MKSLSLQIGINYNSLRSYHSEIKMNRFKSKSKYENPGRPHNLSLELKYEIINQTKILNPRNTAAVVLKQINLIFPHKNHSVRDLNMHIRNSHFSYRKRTSAKPDMNSDLVKFMHCQASVKIIDSLSKNLVCVW